MRTARGGNRARHAHPPGQGSMIGAAGLLLVSFIVSAASGGDAGSWGGFVVTVVLVVGAVIVGLQKLGWLPAGSVAKAEHERAERAEQALNASLAREQLLESRVRDLEARTDLTPLIDTKREMAEAIRQMAAVISDNNTVVRELVRANRTPNAE